MSEDQKRYKLVCLMEIPQGCFLVYCSMETNAYLGWGELLTRWWPPSSQDLSNPQAWFGRVVTHDDGRQGESLGFLPKKKTNNKIMSLTMPLTLK